MDKKPGSSFNRKPKREQGEGNNFRRKDDSGKKSFGKTKSDRPFRDPKEKPERDFKRSDKEGTGKTFRDKKEFPERNFRKSNSERGEKPEGRKNFFDKERPEKFKKDNADFPKRSFNKDKEGDERFDRKKNFEKKPFVERGKKSFDKESPERFKKDNRDFSKKSFDKKDREGDNKFDRKKSFEKKPFGDRERKSIDKDSIEGKPKRSSGKWEERKAPDYKKKEGKFEKPDGFADRKKRSGKYEDSNKGFEKKPFKKKTEEVDSTEERAYPKHEQTAIESAMTLNKYIAHSGECSRRDAAEFVKQGKVRVNGELVLEPGYRVVPGDQVTLSGKKLTPQKGLVYILMNKPKGYITTTEDPEERKTVMDLVTNAGVDRLFPVGRLDRNTTGVLLLTNDGAIAHRLSHPSYNIKKVYHVTLDKNLSRVDYEKIVKGVELEDGKAEVDELAYLDNRHELGLEIHSGRNRIVRRIFESLGYNVEKLDRVMYAGLTKKNVTRGKWRFLTEKEIIFLKHFKG